MLRNETEKGKCINLVNVAKCLNLVNINKMLIHGSSGFLERKVPCKAYTTIYFKIGCCISLWP